ncbi:MAG: zeta toxin family protein [Candidatus Omnitrophica bacterium]|nr:zeta toxin family protein [Candidatus Omnitrophota bacterium]
MKIKNVYIIAGPNGSGKTTFAREFLPGYARCPNFVNADLIAQGLSPFSPAAAAIKSGRLVLEEIRRFAHKHAEFGFETTLSGRSYVNLFRALRAQGYRLHLFFLWIPGADLAVTRIKDRVAEGGHHVPAQDVRRRFSRSIVNFFTLYEPLLDSWMFFNNAGAVPALIAKRKNGQAEIIDGRLFQEIKENVR